MQSTGTLVSLIVPLYNEESLVPELFRRVLLSLGRLEETNGVKTEFIVINDGSRDGTLSAVVARQESEPRLVVVDLSRNFGHQAAIQAGLSVAEGEAIAIMDGDLQDPPELLPELFECWKSGYQVVIAKRRSRKERGLRKLLF